MNMLESAINAVSRVVVVVLNWNSCDDTHACLDSLRSLTYPCFSVILVDNGSTDDSVDRLRAYSASYPLKLLETGDNLGYAGGNNVGTRYALEHGAEFILLLNNDTVVAPDLLERLVESAQRHRDAGAFSARIMYFSDRERVWFDGACWNAQALQLEWPGQGATESALGTSDHDTDYACGAALFFRASLARQIGLLDEAFFLVWEEVDWGFRARKAGWRCMVVPAAKVWHKIGVSFGSESSPLRTYFSIRNELLWFSRHASLPARARLWLKSLRRLTPRFSIDDRAGSALKSLLWATQDYGRAWLGRGGRLQYLAVRRAILDYANRRFGDCPPEVREWARAWTAKQRNA